MSFNAASFLMLKQINKEKKRFRKLKWHVLRSQFSRTFIDKRWNDVVKKTQSKLKYSNQQTKNYQQNSLDKSRYTHLVIWFYLMIRMTELECLCELSTIRSLKHSTISMSKSYRQRCLYLKEAAPKRRIGSTKTIAQYARLGTQLHTISYRIEWNWEWKMIMMMMMMMRYLSPEWQLAAWNLKRKKKEKESC